MALTLTSNYNGDASVPFVRLLEKSPVTDHFYLSLGTKLKKQLPTFGVDANLVQKYKPTPHDLSTLTVGGNTITPKKGVAYLRFNPEDFDDFWIPNVRNGNDFGQLSPELQEPIVMAVMERFGNWFSQQIFQGDSSLSAETQVLDGLETVTEADANINDITGTTLSSSNIVTELEKVRASVTANSPELRNDPNWGYIMNLDAFDLYQEAIYDQTNKGNDFTAEGPSTYRGRKIVPMYGVSDDTIISTAFTNTRESNIWMVGLTSPDALAIQVDKLQADSDLWFVKIVFSLGIGVKHSAQFHLYN